MKVLFVCREYPPFEVGGAAVHTYNLVKSLTKIGVDCKVLAFGDPTYSNAEVTFLEPKSSIVNRCNCPLKNDLKIPLDILRIARFANRLIKTENFDIVHVEEPYVGSFVRHKRKITTVHDTSYGDIKSLASTGAHFANFKRILFYLSMGFFFEFTCIASSSLVITPSKQIKHELTDIYRTSRDKVLVLRSGVNLPDLPSVIDKHAAKKKLGLPEDELLVFTTSQHIPRKRLETLLFAVSLFNKEQEGYKVVIAGDGPSHDILLNQAKKLGLDEVVVFPGWVSRSELELYYQAADIFVMASEYEAGPITLLEAMSFYDVAVSSRIDGIPALMTDYKDGLLFPVGDSAYLGKCLQQLINDPALCSKLSTSARVFAEKFDWKIIAEQTKKIYQELL